MSYLFVIILVILQAIIGCDTELGVSQSQLYSAFTYPFVHANWLHLIVNAISILLMFRPLRALCERQFGEMSRLRMMMMIYGGAVLAGVVSAGEVPTVGSSGMVFFMLGMLLCINPTLGQVWAYLPIAIVLLLQWWFGTSNVLLHVVAMVIGFLWIAIKKSSIYLRTYREYDDSRAE